MASCILITIVIGLIHRGKQESHCNGKQMSWRADDSHNVHFRIFWILHKMFSVVLHFGGNYRKTAVRYWTRSFFPPKFGGQEGSEKTFGSFVYIQQAIVEWRNWVRAPMHHLCASGLYISSCFAKCFVFIRLFLFTKGVSAFIFICLAICHRIPILLLFAQRVIDCATAHNHSVSHSGFLTRLAMRLETTRFLC